MTGLRIWHQGISDLTAMGDYPELLKAHAVDCTDLSTVVDVHGVARGTYPNGVAPMTVLRHSSLESLLGQQLVMNAVRAEREGYNAVAVTCFFDPVLAEMRDAVSIPVVSIFESTVRWGLERHPRLVMLAMDTPQAGHLRGLVKRMEVEESRVVIATMAPEMNEHDLGGLENAPQVLERVATVVHALDLSDDDAVVPAEGYFNLMLARAGYNACGANPLVDSVGVLLRDASKRASSPARAGAPRSDFGAWYAHMLSASSKALADHGL